MPTDPPQNNLLEVPTTVVVNDIMATEVDPRKRAELEELGKQDAGGSNLFWASFGAGLLDLCTLPITAAAFLFDKMMVLASRFFRAAQGENNSTAWELSAAILGDLLGVEVDAAALKQSRFGSGRLAGMEALGKNLYDVLSSEFQPSSGNLETPEAAPAQRFLGFLMNFAIREGNVALLSEFIPEELNFIKGFREYGTTMAKNLGLGRMAARALRPLPQILVADPLTRQLNAQYRPHRLAKEQAIKAFFRKSMTEAELRKELAEEGYSEGRQNLMVLDSRPILSDREIIHLWFRGSFDDAALTKELTERGWADTDIPGVIEAERPQLTASDVMHLGLYGAITSDDVLTGLGKLGYNVTTAGLLWQAFLMEHDPSRRVKPLPSRHRTVLQLHKEFIDGVIDLLEWETELTRQGYSDDDRAAMTQDLLLDQANRRTTRTTHAVPSLSWAQLKAAFKAGVLDLEEVKVHLTHRGYSAPDIDILIKELPAAPAPNAPTGP